MPPTPLVARLAIVVLLGSFGASCGSADVPPPLPSPQDVVNELLAAAGAAAAASDKTTLVPGLAAMFAEDIVMPQPGGFVSGLSAVKDALGKSPENATARLEWAPVRGGVSADGLHGFTFGFMTMHLPDGSSRPMKYLAYWVNRDGRWQVAAYKRVRRPEGEVSTALMDPALPARIQPATIDAAALAANEQSLKDAERGFSDDAQAIGLGPAFAKNGSADAMNLGGPGDPGFVISAEAISHTVTTGAPYDAKPFNWSAEYVIVASSGDLGVTFGHIRRNPPPPGTAPLQPPGPFSFFTIWRRESPDAPWRYIAE